MSEQRTELAVISPPRLPFHPAVEERFGVDRSGWKALVEAIFPLAKSPDAVVMALAYCKARKLDPFKRPVHIVPMWSSAVGEMVETVWPGISELRTTAFRTGQYAGMEAAQFGPMITHGFVGEAQKGRIKGQKRSIEVTYPEWCQITVWRILNGERISFTSPKVYWTESYAKWADTDVPNDMWAKRPAGQLEKCTEAAALRRAFPEEVGNDYAAEEMEGQRLGFVQPEIIPATSQAERIAAKLAEATSAGNGFDHGNVVRHLEGEIVESDLREVTLGVGEPEKDGSPAGTTEALIAPDDALPPVAANDPPPPPPATPDEYATYVRAWLPMVPTATEVEAQWKGERTLRVACGVTSGDFLEALKADVQRRRDELMAPSYDG